MLGKFKSELKDENGHALTGRGKFVGEMWYGIQDTDRKITAKAAGADREVIKEYLNTCNDPVKAFDVHFPANVKPYKTLECNENGKYYYKWFSSWEPKIEPSASEKYKEE